jgi:RNA polymerase sigma-70 factor (sigma-E family)
LSDRLADVEEQASMAAFEDFAREHARSLFGTAYLLCGDPDRAAELVQEALVAALSHWDRVNRASSPIAYVRRSLVNRFVDAHRGPRSRVIAMADIPETTPVRDIADAAVAHEAVRALLSILPARPRAVVVLKYLYDWPDHAIADAINSRVATVRSITRRTLAALRDAAGTDTDLDNAPAANVTGAKPPTVRRRTDD